MRERPDRETARRPDNLAGVGRRRVVIVARGFESRGPRQLVEANLVLQPKQQQSATTTKGTIQRRIQPPRGAILDRLGAQRSGDLRQHDGESLARGNHPTRNELLERCVPAARDLLLEIRGERAADGHAKRRGLLGAHVPHRVRRRAVVSGEARDEDAPKIRVHRRGDRCTVIAESKSARLDLMLQDAPFAGVEAREPREPVDHSSRVAPARSGLRTSDA